MVDAGVRLVPMSQSNRCAANGAWGRDADEMDDGHDGRSLAGIAGVLQPIAGTVSAD
jgi:hypothetical protein